MSAKDDLDDLEDWSDSDKICPECGRETEIGSWWDDPPELGGSCIGHQYKCKNCDWWETW